MSSLWFIRRNKGSKPVCLFHIFRKVLFEFNFCFQLQRAYAMQLFLRLNPAFTKCLTYEFQPCDGDQVNTLCAIILFTFSAQRMLYSSDVNYAIIKSMLENLDRSLTYGPNAVRAEVRSVQRIQAQIFSSMDQVTVWLRLCYMANMFQKHFVHYGIILLWFCSCSS